MSWSNLAEEILEDFVEVAVEARSRNRPRLKMPWNADVVLRQLRDQAWERRRANELRATIPTLAPNHLASCIRCRSDLEQRPGTKVLAAHRCRSRIAGVIPIAPKQA